MEFGEFLAGRGVLLDLGVLLFVDMGYSIAERSDLIGDSIDLIGEFLAESVDFLAYPGGDSVRQFLAPLVGPIDLLG